MQLLRLLCDIDFFTYTLVCDVKLNPKEVVTVNSVLSSCKTLKTSEMINIIILVKRDKLPPYGDQRLQRINAG